MPHRYHLDSTEGNEGTIWFTLVFDNSTQFFVEKYNDSSRVFVKERFKKIYPDEFGGYQINSIPLGKLVASKLKEIHSSPKKPPDATPDRPDPA